MIRPSYIIAAEHIVEDVTSRLLSTFNILEAIQVTFQKGEDKSKAIKFPSFRIASVWIADESDKGKTFEFEFSVFAPPNNMEIRTSKGEFTLQSRIHRLISEMTVQIPLSDGIMCFTCRVRPKDTDTWSEITLPVIVATLIQE